MRFVREFIGEPFTLDEFDSLMFDRVHFDNNSAAELHKK